MVNLVLKEDRHTGDSQNTHLVSKSIWGQTDWLYGQPLWHWPHLKRETGLRAGPGPLVGPTAQGQDGGRGHLALWTSIKNTGLEMPKHTAPHPGLIPIIPRPWWERGTHGAAHRLFIQEPHGRSPCGTGSSSLG